MERVYKILLPTPFPVGPVNVYLIEGEGLTLIDSGPNTPEAWEALVQGFSYFGVSFKDLRRIIITHGHSDHYGLAARIVRESGAEVWAHEGDRWMIEDHPKGFLQWVDFLRRFLPSTGLSPGLANRICDYIAERQDYAMAVELNRVLKDGDRLHIRDFVLEVIASPGHSPGHICLLEPSSGYLFSGDQILKKITPNPILQPFSDFFGERFQGLVSYRRSLERLHGLSVETVLPGHGEEFHALNNRLEEIHRHIEERKGSFLAILRKGWLTPLQVAEDLFPDLPRSQILLALFEVIGHLDLLQKEGRIKVKEREGILFISLLKMAP